jgi:hypothetical protein
MTRPERPHERERKPMMPTESAAAVLTAIVAREETARAAVLELRPDAAPALNGSTPGGAALESIGHALTRHCAVCRGVGFVEERYSADVPSYSVPTGRRSDFGNEIATHYNPPTARRRELCASCGGRGRVATAAVVAFLRSLAELAEGRTLDDATPEAIGSFNREEAAQLAAAAKAHEAERQRHEEANALLDATKAAAEAIRKGEAPPPEAAGLLSRWFGRKAAR